MIIKYVYICIYIAWWWKKQVIKWWVMDPVMCIEPKGLGINNIISLIIIIIKSKMYKVMCWHSAHTPYLI